MMTDSDDDYMSDKILMECNATGSEDVRPGLLFNRGLKRAHELHKKKEELKAKKFRPLKQIEKDVREEGLGTAISADNKGFKLLEKMGFKQGEGLGKSGAGLREPINIVVRQGTSGLGRESHQQEIWNRRREMKSKKICDRENKFRITNREKKRLQILRSDFFNAQRVCEELDYRIHRSDPVEDFYWTKKTIKKKRKEERQNIIQDEEEDEDSDDEEFETQINEENLNAIINYLRNKHLYCLYCIMTGTNDEDLRENCPGPYRIDHDPEYD
ncbi:G patch domain-containing protein 11 [Coccinella septempunctata]|uniref:G patch domain-containing protein 11 n=1 Tax=Coccinella septempunctata TaxID=41139 RepID=UPI001D0641C1|nr:G patch domain-containing protein 11 [Coccinella septempunctata]